MHMGCSQEHSLLGIPTPLMNLGPSRRVPGGGFSVRLAKLREGDVEEDDDDDDNGRTGNHPVRHSAQEP